MEPVVVACASDSRYALPLAVMLRSLLEHLAPERRLEVYAVDDGIDAPLKARVERSLTARAALHWVKPQRSSMSDLPVWGRMPATTYDRLMLAELLPASADRAIWLDCDLLVLHDIGRLWEMDLAGRHLLAVPDPLVPSVASRLGVAGHVELGIPPDAPYFNAGVMLVDTSLWRRDDVRGRCLAYLERFRERVFFLEQEALNAVLAGRWSALEVRWNRSASVDRLHLGGEASDPDPYILHFSGSLKPWQYRSRGRHHALYNEYLDRTAWAGWRPAKTLRGTLLGLYESSRLRRGLQPLERRSVEVMARLTRRYVAVGDGSTGPTHE
jgi:lipopolysaccharide biosynthesis glycosyltransferase